MTYPPLLWSVREPQVSDPCAMCGGEPGAHVPGCSLAMWTPEAQYRRTRVRDYPLSDPIDDPERERLRAQAPVHPGEVRQR